MVLLFYTLQEVYKKFVAVVSGSDIAAYSADGINWATAAFPESAYWSGVAYGNEKFVTVSDVSSNKAAYCEFA